MTVIFISFSPIFSAIHVLFLSDYVQWNMKLSDLNCEWFHVRHIPCKQLEQSHKCNEVQSGQLMLYLWLLCLPAEAWSWRS